MRHLDSVSAAKVLLAIIVVMAMGVIVLDAQAAEAAQISSGVHMDLQQWSPATVLAVFSVVFSFGISYQTIRIHGKVLQDFENWRNEHVDPKISHHATEIEVLKAKVGPWDGTERRKQHATRK